MKTEFLISLCNYQSYDISWHWVFYLSVFSSSVVKIWLIHLSVRKQRLNKLIKLTKKFLPLNKTLMGVERLSLIHGWTRICLAYQSSFLPCTKLVTLTFLYCLNFHNSIGTDISHLNFNSRPYDRCKFTFKLIPLVITSNLFPLEIVWNANKYCQLCVLWKNSSANDLHIIVRGFSM